MSEEFDPAIEWSFTLLPKEHVYLAQEKFRGLSPEAKAAAVDHFSRLREAAGDLSPEEVVARMGELLEKAGLHDRR